MKKVPFIILCSLSALAIGLSTFALVRSFIPEEHPLEYTMYIGTNDKDTYQCEIGVDAARTIVHNRMMDHFSDGFTMYEGKGVWRDKNNVITLEYTFICVLESVERKEVYAVADELLVDLNQSTILIVTNLASSVDFYTGK